MIKTCCPDHQTINMVVKQATAMYAVTCTVCLHFFVLTILYWVSGMLM